MKLREKKMTEAGVESEKEKTRKKKPIGCEEEMVNIRARDSISAEQSGLLGRRRFNRMAIKVSSKSDYMRRRQSMTVSYMSCKGKNKKKGAYLHVGLETQERFTVIAP